MTRHIAAKDKDRVSDHVRGSEVCLSTSTSLDPLIESSIPSISPYFFCPSSRICSHSRLISLLHQAPVHLIMPKQAFGDFLSLQAGPSTPRGRGRGGGTRGGRGGFGGGRGGATVAKRSYNADYTNVGFDYDAINKQGYRKMEGELIPAVNAANEGR